MHGKPFEIYYGQSGSAKSTAAERLIREFYKLTGKKARVLVGDGSSATYEALVGAGVVEMADYTIRDWPMSTLDLFCQGHWPEDVNDPKSKMLPMTREIFDSISMYVIEGLSVGANYIMGDKRGGLAERAGRGEKIGQDSPIQIVDQLRNAQGQLIESSGPGTVFGGNPLAHYGVAQRRMLGFLEKSKALPGWVIWTAHERASEDRISNEKLIGPEVSGGALTATISRVANNTLHFATAVTTKKSKDTHTDKQVDTVDAEYRIYTKDHFRAEGNSFVKYKAVSRTPDPASMPLYFTSDVPGDAIVAFYDNIAEARKRQIADLKPAA